MHDSPRQGVVDRQCKVHGMTNLYIAGSSVFPTAGANYPTITIAALTLRLSAHIARQLKRPEAGLPVPDAVSKVPQPANEPMKNRYASATPSLAAYPHLRVRPDNE